MSEQLSLDFEFDVFSNFFQHASYENRVYEVEIENRDDGKRSKFILKVYRPGRWTKEQIDEEIQFTLDCAQDEIPVAKPLKHKSGVYLGTYVLPVDNAVANQTLNLPFFYAFYEKKGGRQAEDLDLDGFETLGRWISRLHQTGRKSACHARKPFFDLDRLEKAKTTYSEFEFQDRIVIDPSLASLIHSSIDQMKVQIQSELCKLPVQRIHGDFHRGNVLWHPTTGPTLIDLDDFSMGPVIQDLWLLFSNEDFDPNGHGTSERFQSFIKGYETFSEFSDNWIRHLKDLRRNRLLLYGAWVIERFDEPLFQKTFEQYKNRDHWVSFVNSIQMA